LLRLQALGEVPTRRTHLRQRESLLKIFKALSLKISRHIVKISRDIIGDFQATFCLKFLRIVDYQIKHFFYIFSIIYTPMPSKFFYPTGTIPIV